MSVVVQRNGVRIVAFNKSGNTSIVNTFQCPFGGTPQRGVRNLEVLKAPSSSDFPEPIVTIAYFRHPLARLASVYNYFFELPRREVIETDSMAKVQPTEFRVNFKVLGFRADMNFEDFCEQIIAKKDRLHEDLHIKKQSESFIADRGLAVDTWIARLDELSTVWSQMVSTFHLDCSTRIAHFNNQVGYSWVAMYQDIPVVTKLLLELYHDDHRIWQMRSCYLI